MSPPDAGRRSEVSSDPIRERIAAAMVELVGSRGYEATALEEVCERAGVGRVDFDRRFAGKEECFLDLHEQMAAELCRLIDAAYRGSVGWHNRIWAVGWATMRYLQDDPVRARFFLAELDGVGEAAQAHRDRLLQRLADLIDEGRTELPVPGPASRCTAEIVAGSLYCAILGKLKGGWIERGEHFLPELIYIVMVPYLGARAAEAELAVQSLG